VPADIVQAATRLELCESGRMPKLGDIANRAKALLAEKENQAADLESIKRLIMAAKKIGVKNIPEMKKFVYEPTKSCAVNAVGGEKKEEGGQGG